MSSAHLVRTAPILLLRLPRLLPLLSGVHVRACVRARARARARACARARARVGVRARVRVRVHARVRARVHACVRDVYCLPSHIRMSHISFI